MRSVDVELRVELGLLYIQRQCSRPEGIYKADVTAKPVQLIVGSLTDAPYEVRRHMQSEDLSHDGFVWITWTNNATWKMFAELAGHSNAPCYTLQIL